MQKTTYLHYLQKIYKQTPRSFRDFEFEDYVICRYIFCFTSYLQKNSIKFWLKGTLKTYTVQFKALIELFLDFRIIMKGSSKFLEHF